MGFSDIPQPPKQRSASGHSLSLGRHLPYQSSAPPLRPRQPDLLLKTRDPGGAGTAIWKAQRITQLSPGHALRRVLQLAPDFIAEFCVAHKPTSSGSPPLWQPIGRAIMGARAGPARHYATAPRPPFPARTALAPAHHKLRLPGAVLPAAHEGCLHRALKAPESPVNRFQHAAASPRSAQDRARTGQRP